MHRLITLYRSIHAWLYDVEHTHVVYVGIQTVHHGMIYAAMRVREE